MPNFIKPVIGGVTSPFGMRNGVLHAGTDFGAPMGSAIHASMDGTVTRAEWFDGYGLATDIDHGGGYMTRYGHQSSIKVKKGDKVRQGDVIGLVGSTGDSTGPHLHFEIRINGKPVNPMNYLSGKAVFLPVSNTVGITNPLIPTSLSEFLQDLASKEFWVRALMFLLGVIFLGLAIIAMVKKGS